jgi:hypothetical protein
MKLEGQPRKRTWLEKLFTFVISLLIAAGAMAMLRHCVWFDWSR